MNKVRNEKVTPEFLKSKISEKYGKQKWIIFCEILLTKGYTLKLYEAKKTFSKYITVIKNGRYFKVRFSNHKPSMTKQIIEKDSDFYVGVSRSGITTTEDALKAVEKHFSKNKLFIRKVEGEK